MRASSHRNAMPPRTDRALRALAPMLARSRQALLFLVLGALGATAQAVVLGPMLVQSRSGETLQADIVLRRVKPSEAQALQVSIGDEAAYQEAQLQRPAIASQLKVELVPRGERLRLQVRSTQPVQDKRLDVVVVVQWPAGRVVRSYTLLLDSDPLVAPVTSVVVNRGDIAQRIAMQHKGDQASVDQMLVALLQANPDAFVGGNVNRLRVGAVLQMPSPAEAAKIDPAQARETLQEQQREFASRRSASARSEETATPPKRARKSDPDAPNAREAAKAPTPAASAPPAPPADRLTLTKPVTDASASASAAREQQLAAQAQAQADAQRIDALQRNIEQLNRTIADLNRSVEALQRKTVESVTAAASAVGGAATTAAPAPSTPAPAAEPPVAPREGATLIGELVRHPATPVATGALLALLLLVALYRVRRRARADEPSADARDELAPSWMPAGRADATQADSVAPPPPVTTPAASTASSAATGLPPSIQGLSLDLGAPPANPAAAPRAAAVPAVAPVPPAPATQLLDDPMAVKLAIAEEFRAIGSIDAARELAREVAALADEPLQSRAQQLIAQLDLERR
ncbi:MAG: hypothetical protein EBS99_11840 [Betaproteobacteria bacterium]|nr:hypothetical protein [Betaproteobacteria bacterium]